MIYKMINARIPRTHSEKAVVSVSAVERDFVCACDKGVSEQIVETEVVQKHVISI